MASTRPRCLVSSRLDCCNSKFHNKILHQQTCLQRLINKAARAVLNINSPDHYPRHFFKKMPFLISLASRATKNNFQACTANFQISIDLHASLLEQSHQTKEKYQNTPFFYFSTLQATSYHKTSFQKCISYDLEQPTTND